MWTAFINVENIISAALAPRVMLPELMQPHRIAWDWLFSLRKYSGYTILITSFMTQAITIRANL